MSNENAPKFAHFSSEMIFVQNLMRNKNSSDADLIGNPQNVKRVLRIWIFQLKKPSEKF